MSVIEWWGKPDDLWIFCLGIFPAGVKLRRQIDHCRGMMNRTHERDELWRGGHVLGNHQHKDGERQKDGDSQRDLLAGVGRQPEPDQAERSQPETRKDDVEEIVESSAADDDCESDVRVRLHTTRVNDLIAFDTDWKQLPLAVEYVVGQVNRSWSIDHVYLHADHTCAFSTTRKQRYQSTRLSFNLRAVPHVRHCRSSSGRNVGWQPTSAKHGLSAYNIGTPGRTHGPICRPTKNNVKIGRVSYLIYVSMRHYVLTTSDDIVVCFHTAVCLSC